MKIIDISNQVFGKLTAVSYAGSCPSGASWNCICECGKELVVSKSHLSTGHTKSCGCIQAGKPPHNITHNRSRTKDRTYKTWKEMRQRCMNENSDKWKWYGGRGISVCERWNDFELFLEDMGERPEGMTIDRIDNNGNYEPNNCRWATHKEQTRKQSTNVFVQNEADYIREIFANAEKTRGLNAKICEFFGVSTSAISAITLNKSWA